MPYTPKRVSISLRSFFAVNWIRYNTIEPQRCKYEANTARDLLPSPRPAFFF